MTSLSQQLKQLALPGTDFKQELTKRPSLLFDSWKAATLDCEAFYALGVNGFDGLCCFDETFRDEFLELFNESAKNTERSVMFKDDIRKLDTCIRRFLFRAAPYFSTRSVQKCLEWLIYRFKVHYFNSEDMLKSFLPCSETKLFSRLAQLFDKSRLGNNWSWVAAIQTSRVTATRMMISEHCLKNFSLFSCICDGMMTAIEVHASRKNCSGAVRPAINFFAALILATACNVQKNSNQFLSHLLPYIIKVLKSPLIDCKAAAYVIICHISTKMSLTEKGVESLLEAICKYQCEEMNSECMVTIITVCETQENLKCLPNSCISSLCSMLEFVEQLEMIVASHETGGFLKLFFRKLIFMIHDEKTHAYDIQDRIIDFQEILFRLLQKIYLSQPLQKLVIRDTMEWFLNLDPTVQPAAFRIVELLQKKYVDSFFMIVPILRGKMVSSEVEPCLKQPNESVNISNTADDKSFADPSFGALLLTLCHMKPSFRVSAVASLDKLLTSSPWLEQSDFVRNLISLRLSKDESSTVVAAALDLVGAHKLTFFHDLSQACCILIGIVLKRRLGDEWINASQCALGLLTSECFLSCISKTACMITMIVYDALLHDSCMKRQSKKHCCLMLNHFWGRNPQVFSLSVKKSAESPIRDMINEVGKTPEILPVLLAASRNIHSIKLNHLSYSNIPPLTPSYFLVQYVAIHVVLHKKNLPVQSDDFRFTRMIFMDILQDIKGLLAISKKEIVGPGKAKAKKRSSQDYINAMKDFDFTLQTMAASFWGDEGQDSIVFHCIGVLFSLLLNGLELIKGFATVGQRKRHNLWEKIPSNLDDRDECMDVFELYDMVRSVVLSLFLQCLPWAASQLTSAVSTSLNELMKYFFTNFFSSLEEIIWFLTPWWSLSTSATPDDLLSQTHALCLGSKIIQSSESLNVGKLLLPTCSAIPSMLVAVSGKAPALTRAAIRCMAAISDSKQKGTFLDLVQYIVSHSEILESQGSLPCLLGQFFASEPIKRSTHAARLPHAHSKILEVLLRQFICAEVVPTRVRVLLLQLLRKVNSELVCVVLMPALSKLMDLTEHRRKKAIEHCETGPSYHDATLLREMMLKIDGKFLRNLTIRSVFVKAMRCDVKLPLDPESDVSPQSISLGMVNKSFFAALSNEIQEDILVVMHDIGAQGQECTKISLLKVFKAISMDSHHVKKELEKMFCRDKFSQPTFVKKVKDQEISNHLAVDLESDEWRKTIFLLESLQHKKKMTNMEVLFPNLLWLVEITLEMSTDENAHKLEYVKQLVMTTLLNTLHRLKDTLQGRQKIKFVLSSHCKVELFVHCIRSTENIQSQHQALLLLCEVASLFPEKVLHNLMTIFTFMGSRLLREDNSHTFQVISKTIQTIIPAMTNFNKTSINTEKISLNIIRAFVDSLPHIPPHRRVIILGELLTAFGGVEHLWIVLLLLTYQYACKPVSEKEHSPYSIEANLDTDSYSRSTLVTASNVWNSVCEFFPLTDQMENFVKCLEYLIDLPIDKVEQGTIQRDQIGKLDVINVKTLTTAQIRRFHLSLLTFVSSSLEGKRNKLLRSVERSVLGMKSLTGDAELVPLLQRLFQELISLLCKASVPRNCAPNQSMKFLKALVAKTHDVLQQVNAVLPLNALIRVIESLLKTKDVFTKTKCLELLAKRIVSAAANFLPDEVTSVVRISTDIACLAAKSTKESLTTEHDHNVLRYTSLITLKIAVRSCGRLNQEGFVEVLPELCYVISNNEEEDIQVLSAAFLCLAELCTSLGAYTISHLDRFMPDLLRLTCSCRSLQNEALLFSCLTVIHRLLENLLDFTSTYIVAVLEKVTSLMLMEKYNVEDHCPTEDRNISVQIAMRLKVLTNIIARNVPSRILIGALNKCFRKDDEILVHRIKPLSTIILKHVSILSKERVELYSSALAPLLHKLLDVRINAQENLPAKEIEDIEDWTTEAAVAMLLKLSEKLFRIFFFEFSDWACNSGNPQGRLITYFKLMMKFSMKMKGIFSLFAETVINNSVAVFVANLESELILKEKHTLLTLVCDTLHSTFRHDTSGILTKERVEMIVQPLVDQIDNIRCGHAETDNLNATLVYEHVIPCLGQLASSAVDDSCWKVINYKILVKSRNAFSEVRYSSLCAIQTVAERLGDDYTQLLPESLPFIAEMMEDDDEKVEKKSHDVIKNLEKILGKPLQNYFS